MVVSFYEQKEHFGTYSVLVYGKKNEHWNIVVTDRLINMP